MGDHECTTPDCRICRDTDFLRAVERKCSGAERDWLNEVLARLEAAETEADWLRGQAPMWRDIGTAPKDGTEVLTCRANGLREVARWNEAADWADAGWGGSGWRFPKYDQPTRWQPLPPPPEGK